MKPNGMILWEGRSLLDSQPIVVIATGLRRASANTKTGGMIQTYILRADVEPTTAIKSGQDASICGDCPHRGDGTGKGRTCYVNVGQGPLAVFRAYKRGSYPQADIHALYAAVDGRPVRFGTYGDPAAAPRVIWELLADWASTHTGYTHQWRRVANAPAWARLLMASADTREEAAEAHAAGWRTFRVATDDEPRMAGEILCPASAEAGAKLTCEQCGACEGTANQRRGSIYIPLHGGFAVMANKGKLEERLIARG